MLVSVSPAAVEQSAGKAVRLPLPPCCEHCRGGGTESQGSIIHEKRWMGCKQGMLTERGGPPPEECVLSPARDFHIHDRGADLGIVTVTICPLRSQPLLHLSTRSLLYLNTLTQASASNAKTSQVSLSFQVNIFVSVFHECYTHSRCLCGVSLGHSAINRNLHLLSLCCLGSLDFRQKSIRASRQPSSALQPGVGLSWSRVPSTARNLLGR
ncbi:unnamed protein product [Pleuronectes platessa]|uniref:Uncharacterized protein n=1 Tax=Pleuronectes platessa TaxID=8262 RepID=A0A9N7VPH2_PLEPL|nr:unnamed protein product [Pleuronectes platessa]